MPKSGRERDWRDQLGRILAQLALIAFEIAAGGRPVSVDSQARAAPKAENVVQVTDAPPSAQCLGVQSLALLPSPDLLTSFTSAISAIEAELDRALRRAA